ncbi:CGNR zinc finger domain-containing protein [Azospirillum halopraeferens]|uniref:CGNR zinc finger domain-containing protein n=1 Tax=Azospirillum halopraeferens TaxID=34010 RepID=UPI00048C815E|nr:ABATE domain-containing protein [Azospirillum halopraeferens]
MQFTFLGNAAWLDFLNTAPRDEGRTVDLLSSPESLRRWGQEAGLLGSEIRDGVDETWLIRAKRLRGEFRQGADSLLAGQEPPTGVIKAVNDQLIANPLRLTLHNQAGHWHLAQMPLRPHADVLLTRLAIDFAECLVSGRVKDLRRCARSNCVMLFLDTSKNHSRRWCSMELCGNREKAAGRRARGAAGSA